MPAAIDALPGELRSDAGTLRQYGDERGAALLEAVADRVALALRIQADELLPLADAARESGYSSDRLRHMIADGRLPNGGRKGAPRIRRGDLPSKPRRVSAGAYDPNADAHRILTRRRGH